MPIGLGGVGLRQMVEKKRTSEIVVRSKRGEICEGLNLFIIVETTRELELERNTLVVMVVVVVEVRRSWDLRWWRDK